MPPDMLALGGQLREVLREELKRLSNSLREDVRSELQQSLRPEPPFPIRSVSRNASFKDERESSVGTEPPNPSDLMEQYKLKPPRSIRGFKSMQYVQSFKTFGSLSNFDDLLGASDSHRLGVRSEGLQRLPEPPAEPSPRAPGAREERGQRMAEREQKDPDAHGAAGENERPTPPANAVGTSELPDLRVTAAKEERPLGRSWTLLVTGESKQTIVEPFAPIRQTSASEPGLLQSPSSAHGIGGRNHRDTIESSFSSTDPDVWGSRRGSAEDMARLGSGRRSTLGSSTRRFDSADKAMALAPKAAIGQPPGQPGTSRSQQVAQLVARSTAFELFVMVMIIASAVHIGLQTDYMARNVLRSSPTSYRVMEIIFCAVFTVEILVRVYAYRLDFLRMYGWAWNLFDFILVASQLLEELIMAIASSEEDMEAWNTGFLLRTARVLRAVRAIRVLHIARFTNELRLIMSCIVHAMRSFVWASALFMLMMYVVGIYLTQVVLVHRLESTEGTGELALWYGNVPRAVLSLFQGLTGGVDWDVLVRPLITHISPWLGVAFFLYILFAIFAVMNVVTALFVENAIQRAAQVKEVQQVDQAMRLFKSLDMDRSGFITYNDLHDHLETEEVKDFFKSIDVDVSEAKCLFDMLDLNESGVIEFEEFLNGCMRLQGPAKAIDLLLVAREMRTNFQDQGSLVRGVLGGLCAEAPRPSRERRPSEPAS